MNNGLVSKIKNWVSGDPFEDDVYNLEEEYETENRMFRTPARREAEPAMESKKNKGNLKLVDHPTSQMAQVVVIEPRAFEESLEIIEHLRAKKSVILNLHLLDNAQSQRVVDFLSGATHAIDGNQQRIGDGVFIFTPNNVMITSDAEKGLSLNDAFWNQPR
ncbi:MAG: cell division protein SepF [Cyanobacteria bacterium]|jgi:cell division inhibitor SepF|nr:cell division protein SepF [Cyanobacteriota bacterium]